MHFGLGAPLQLVAQLVHFGAALADDDARARCLDVDLQFVGEALDVHLGHARVGKPPLELLAQLQVVVEERLVIPDREPARMPGPVEPQAEPVRMDFLPHATPSLRTRRPKARSSNDSSGGESGRPVPSAPAALASREAPCPR